MPSASRPPDITPAAGRLLRARSARGFTLLETLVALVLIVMAVSLLMGALVQISQIQSRIEELRGQRERLELGLTWWRELISGLQPQGLLRSDTFHGDPQRLKGVSINPVGADAPGRATNFTLEIVALEDAREVALRYQPDGAKPIELLRLPGQRARFQYIEANGTTYDDWPPRGDQPPEIPVVVRLVLDGDGGRRDLFAASGGPARILPRAASLFSNTPLTGPGGSR
jgi:general secretion pathway protein J